MDPLDGLNPEQRRAAEAVRGPVCILAGAGSGKTTTITRRIAQQVATGAFAPAQIMAVTFTDKAAGELKGRLALGVTGVRASTFHSAALRQLRHFAPSAVGRILPSKALALRQIANGCPAPFRFRPAGDLATEIEWAKNRRIGPEGYREAAAEREPPIPLDLMHRVFRDYERRKTSEGMLDFEDLLERTVQLFERERRRVRDVPRAVPRVHRRRVPGREPAAADAARPLARRPRRPLRRRRRLPVDLRRSPGAGPEHLLAVPARFPQALVVRLEENYRSTPQVLALANRLVPNLGGAEKMLRSVLPDGPEPVVRPFTSPAEEGAAIVEQIRSLDCRSRTSRSSRARTPG